MCQHIKSTERKRSNMKREIYVIKVICNEFRNVKDKYLSLSDD